MRADLSSLDTSFSESSNTADGRTEEILNANEKRQSRFWRTFVFLVIIGMAAITGSLVYILTEEQQTEMHEREVSLNVILQENNNNCSYLCILLL